MAETQEKQQGGKISRTTGTPGQAISYWSWPVLLSALVFALDQASKILVDKFFEYGSSRTMIPGIFELVHYRNTGCAWGMLSERTWLLALFSLATFILIAFFFKKWCNNSRFIAISLSLLEGGILGNMIDRAFRCSVIDFLDFHIGVHHWPAFNIADSAICIAVAMLLFDSFFLQKPKQEK